MVMFDPFMESGAGCRPVCRRKQKTFQKQVCLDRAASPQSLREESGLATANGQSGDSSGNGLKDITAYAMSKTNTKA